MTEIRCYRIDCPDNGYERSNCGYCKKKMITFTDRGCMDHRIMNNPEKKKSR